MAAPGPTLLLVDDEPAIRRIAVRVLQRAGFTVLDAGDGEEALAVWRANREEVALIITDVMMPKRNGWELFGEVRAESPDLPFVMTSGYDGSSGTPQPLGPRVEMVGKPWESSRLIEVVRKLLG